MRKENAKGLFMQVVVKNIICIFTVRDGEVFIIVDNKKVPCIVCNDDINIINNNYLSKLKIDNLNLKQTYTFSEKKDDILTLYILFNDIVNYNDIKENLDLVSLENIKYDKFITKSIDYLKSNIVIDDNLNKIFNSEFAIPELQKLLENILNKKFDRRNFRKKLINQNIIQPVDKTSNNLSGRPAKLYKFKKIEKRNII